MSKVSAATTRKPATRSPVRQPEGPSSGMVQKGLAAFFRIAEAWKLPISDQITLLGKPSKSTLYNWKEGRGTSVSPDTLERLSYILGIFRALEILIPSREHANDWIATPNDAPLFGGQPPLELLREGSVVSLYRVRAYLDAQRGGWA